MPNKEPLIEQRSRPLDFFAKPNTSYTPPALSRPIIPNTNVSPHQESPKPVKSPPIAPATTKAPQKIGSIAEKTQGQPNFLVARIAARHPGLEMAMRKQGMRESVYAFVRRLIIISCLFGLVVGLASAIILGRVLTSPTLPILLALMLGIARILRGL